jgi:peptidyl-prolyl cis-trans isomerase SurA
MVRLKKDADAAESTKTESKINQIYTLLNEGMSWQELALKMSEDASTSSKGGELPWFGTGKMVESFEDAAFNLSADGQISEPFKTSYGWHIVKRLEYRAPASFEASKREIEKKSKSR